jgi:CheY-like chemotaxis protein
MTDGEPGDHAPLRILVVDDDETVRDIVCDVLTELGYAAEPARDGADALDRFRPGRYRLVVTDLAMPTMNGFQLAHRLRALEPAIPILVFSAATATGPLAAFGITLIRKPDVEGLTGLIVRTLTGRDGDATNGALSLTGNVDSTEEQASPGRPPDRLPEGG